MELEISQSLLIRGVRGVGKTFLLQKMKQDLKDNFLVSYIDIASIDDKQLTAQLVLLKLLDEINSAINEKINDKKKIGFLLKTLTDKLKIKNFSFSKDTHIAEIPIAASEYNYRKISKFIIEYPQRLLKTLKVLTDL